MFLHTRKLGANAKLRPARHRYTVAELFRRAQRILAPSERAHAISQHTISQHNNSSPCMLERGVSHNWRP